MREKQKKKKNFEKKEVGKEIRAYKRCEKFEEKQKLKRVEKGREK